ncbi:glycine betaine ABC transporter substrate-binding protein [Pantoea sp. FN060301]|uniref:glycine betaine ABC transporter substrate-binding protein n=1 Tax=Pantoea sp. FN060301 TaxID=3420380 RepID=UPI003D182B0B
MKSRLFRWLSLTALALGTTLTLSSPVFAAEPIVFATKSFTEQHILSAMTTQYLRKKGFTVEPRTNIAAIIGRNAMVNRQVDLTWEYTGTSLIIYNHIKKPMSAEEAYQTVKKLDAKLGLVWLDPAPMNNTYAFAMQRERAEKEHIETISQLVEKMDEIRKNDPDNNWMLGLDLEFAGRSDGMKPLQKTYNMKLDRPQIRQMDPGLVYNAIRDGFVEAGLIYTTDGRINGFDLKVLKDDKGFFPSYAATPVATQETLDANPGLAEALNALTPLITNEAITEMNKRVDIDHQSPRKVASDFLKSHGLL